MRPSTSSGPIGTCRCWFVPILLAGCFQALLPAPGTAQKINGALEFAQRPGRIFLYDTKADHLLIDSADVDRKGRFAFAHHQYPAGFYQLAINDTDRVDLILDPRENEVRLSFTGVPVQEHIMVHRSLENQRLWEYKMLGRRNQDKLATIRQQRLGIDPADKAAHARLDSIQIQIRNEQATYLERLLAQDTTSYFTHVVRSDKRITAAAARGPWAIRNAIDWTDGRLLRSSVFNKALMTWIQNAPPNLTDGLISASDSLLKWTAPDPEIWEHTRLFLFRIFDQHGPDFVVQHLVDRYVAGPDAVLPADAELLSILTEQLRVSIGARAPDVLLADPIAGDTTLLYDIIGRHKVTAIFFYSSTCDHCHEQMPHLNELYDRLKEQGFALIGIALDGDREEFQQTLTSEQIGWPAYSDLIGWGSPAAKAFHVKATPTFFVLDSEGRIIAKPYDHLELRADLDRSLN